MVRRTKLITIHHTTENVLYSSATKGQPNVFVALYVALYVYSSETTFNERVQPEPKTK